MNIRPLIYHPSGSAGEYADKGFAVNLYRGCTHGCQYCYVPQTVRMARSAFYSSSVSAPDVLRRLERDMKRIGVVQEPIFLCFTCDPYCKDAPHDLTREAIKIILDSGNHVNILTKGGRLAARDFDLIASPGNLFGTTLTFSHEALSREWEPNAATPWDRINTLGGAHLIGIKTWASIEPVIFPDQSFAVMEQAMPHVDLFKIGKWNHDPRAGEIDWGKFYEDAMSLMIRNSKKYIIKQELKKYLGKLPE